MHFNRDFIRTLFLICGIVFLLFAPDLLYSLYSGKYQLNCELRIIGYLFLPVALGLVLNKYRLLSFFCLALFAVLQLMQFSCLSYFGRLLTQYDFLAIPAEYEDVILGAKDAIKSHWPVLLTVIVPFSLMWMLLLVRVKRTVYGTGILLLTLCGIFYANCFSSIPYPIEGRFSMSNTLKSFSSFTMSLFAGYSQPEYKPYDITNVGIPHNEPITIVYILGESANLSHMSLYGYNRDTNPSLKELAKNQNFYYTEGIAGGVCTKASLRFMSSVIWEPDNVRLNNTCDTSLFRMAKENGFKTFYLASDSTGMVNVVCNTSSKYMDVCITKESERDKAKDLSDDFLLYLIDKQKFSERNFIVLHQRCVHSPYTHLFPKDYVANTHFSGSKDRRIDEYDNAMLYSEAVVARIFNKFNQQEKGKFYIIWASDHNELLGEKGLFGHCIIDPETARVPVFVQSNDSKFMEQFRSIFRPTHYEIANLVAGILGFKVHNPNQQANIFYINGLDYNGRSGYIKVTKNLQTRTLEYEVHS